MNRTLKSTPIASAHAAASSECRWTRPPYSDSPSQPASSCQLVPRRARFQLASVGALQPRTRAPRSAGGPHWHWQWLSPSLTAAPTRPESGNGDSLFPHHFPGGRSGGIGKRGFPPHFPAKSESGIGGNGNWGFPGYSVGRLALLPVSGHTGSEVKLGWFYGDTCSRTIRTLTFKKLGPLAAPHATCPRPRAARSYHASNAPDLTPLGP
jgi:hypothetical protein